MNAGASWPAWMGIATMPEAGETPQARRRARVEQRLRDALTTLRSDPNLPLTAAALARLAGISRNTLYANHRVVLDDLRELCLPRASLPDRPTPQSVEPTLPAVKAQLIAVTTQNAGLLQRALAAEQRADQLESRNAQLVRQLRMLGLPTALNSPLSTSSD